jgi:eukaryotic-like serine/threonine-protein kinase
VDPSREPTIRTADPKSSPSSPVKTLTNSLGMTLIRIEAGEFLMGTTKDQVDQLMRQFPDSKLEWFDDEQPQHVVTITQPIFLSIHPVTQGQYQAVMGRNPNHFKGVDERPVESVSWFDGVDFCNRLSELENQKPYYRVDGVDVTIAGGSGYRLPTEAEWEYTCRAGALTLYPFGDEASQLGEYAWYSDEAGGSTHPVGQKRPNGWGVYDMLGNVYEWCADWYDAKCYASPLAANPLSATAGARRVIRGGCWNSWPRLCRTAARRWFAPEYRNFDLGFRVAVAQE